VPDLAVGAAVWLVAWATSVAGVLWLGPILHLPNASAMALLLTAVAVGLCLLLRGYGHIQIAISSGTSIGTELALLALLLTRAF
jgi:hypothetical protein